jgi:hypothetical protein
MKRKRNKKNRMRRDIKMKGKKLIARKKKYGKYEIMTKQKDV